MLTWVRPKPEDYIELVYNLCNKYRNIKTIEFQHEDILAVGKLELMKAIESYDPSKGKFGPYVKFRIRVGIADYLRESKEWDHNRKLRTRNTVSLNAIEDPNDRFFDYDSIPEDFYAIREIRGYFSDYSEMLPDEYAMIKDMRDLIDSVELDFKYKYVLRMLYINNLHINDLAKEMNCSDKYVFRLRLHAIRALQEVIFGGE